MTPRIEPGLTWDDVRGRIGAGAFLISREVLKRYCAYAGDVADMADLALDQIRRLPRKPAPICVEYRGVLFVGTVR